MDRPAIILILLVALGLGCAGLLWGTKTRSGIARGFKESTDELIREHEHELARVRASAEDADGEGGTDARLLDKVAKLETELQLYQDENARLQHEIDRMVAAGVPPPERGTPDAVAVRSGRASFSVDEEAIRAPLERMVAEIRGLEYQTPATYEFTDWEGMKAALRARSTDSGTGADATGAAMATDRSRAYAAMGFVEPGVDVPEQSSNLLTNQVGAAFYAGNSTVRFNRLGSLASVHDRTALAVELTRLLQDQHFGVNVPPADRITTDARNAARALSIGDTEMVKVRFMLRDEFPSEDALTASPTAMAKEDFEAAPPFVREEFLFPYTVGMSFCQTLHDRDKWKSVDAAYARPPRSTAEILHPELYLADPPIEAVSFGRESPAPEVLGVPPIWDDSAGELGIAVYLSQVDYTRQMDGMGIDARGMMPVLAVQDFSEMPAGKAAAGWRGDRYLVYPNGEGKDGGDHLLWRTAWANDGEAVEFFRALRDALRLRYGLPVPKDGDAEETNATREFRIDGPRHLRLWMPVEDAGTEVRLVNTGDRAWLDALGNLYP